MKAFIAPTNRTLKITFADFVTQMRIGQLENSWEQKNAKHVAFPVCGKSLDPDANASASAKRVPTYSSSGNHLVNRLVVECFVDCQVEHPVADCLVADCSNL